MNAFSKLVLKNGVENLLEDGVLIGMNVENRRRGGPSAFSSFKRQQRRMALQVRELADGAKLTVDKDKLREMALFSLEVLFENAVKLAVDVSCRDWKQKEAWTRTATYIAQTINSVSQSKEAKQIDEDLQRLEQLLVTYKALFEDLNERKLEMEQMDLKLKQKDANARK